MLLLSHLRPSSFLTLTTGQAPDFSLFLLSSQIHPPYSFQRGFPHLHIESYLYPARVFIGSSVIHFTIYLKKHNTWQWSSSSRSCQPIESHLPPCMLLVVTLKHVTFSGQAKLVLASEPFSACGDPSIWNVFSKFVSRASFYSSFKISGQPLPMPSTHHSVPAWFTMWSPFQKI